MPDNFDIHSFFEAVINQDKDKLRDFFDDDATIIWANTNEQFTVDEYIRANCEYPGKWGGKVEDFDVIKDTSDERRMVFTAIVKNAEGYAARTVSFIDFAQNEDELIDVLVENWSDITDPPAWRREMNIGRRYEDC